MCCFDSGKQSSVNRDICVYAENDPSHVCVFVCVRVCGGGGVCVCVCVCVSVC